MKEIELKVAEILLDIGAFRFSVKKPFTYASGLKGPIYCDNRKLLAFPNERSEITQSFLKKITESECDFEGVLAMATGGIAFGSWIAGELEKPFGYIRSMSKSHGKGQQVEGFCKKMSKVIIVEDLVNQGSSLHKALLPLKNDFEFVDCYAVVDYGFEAAINNLNEVNIKCTSLTNFKALTEVAKQKKLIASEELQLIENWYENPQSWGNS